MARNRMTLGRAKYQVTRLKAGDYNDDTGLWEDGGEEIITIRANIQGGLFWNAMKETDAGVVRKQALSIRSDDPLYMADEYTQADIVHYQGGLWEVRDARMYNNLKATRHWEAMAVLLDSSSLPRNQP